MGVPQNQPELDNESPIFQGFLPVSGGASNKSEIPMNP